jgi:hypothetical protein
MARRGCPRNSSTRRRRTKPRSHFAAAEQPIRPSSFAPDDPFVLEVLIAKMGKDRDVDAVLRKCAGVLGQAEPCELIGNFLHRRPRPAEFGLVDPLTDDFTR